MFFKLIICISVILCSLQALDGTRKKKTLLRGYTRAHPPPNPIPNSYWKELASDMNKELHTSRTG